VGLGLYATYRREAGFYVDSVLQLSRRRTAFRARNGAATQLRGRGPLASVELGQPLAIALGWVLKPQAQLMHYRLDLTTAHCRASPRRKRRHQEPLEPTSLTTESAGHRFAGARS
jgi:outer membrane autotransporter protein